MPNLTHPPRALLAAASGWLVALAVLYIWVLTPESTHPVYRWLWGAGLALLPPAVALALATAMPSVVARQSLWLAAQGMMLFSGAVSLLLLLAGAVMGGATAGQQALLPYGVAVALLAATLYGFWFRVRRARTQGPA